MPGSIGPVRNPSTSAQRAAPLFRGTGCHNCRTRKVKCDAGKPFCVRCIQHNSTDKCKYDKVKKSKLTLAKEEIASLKERLAQIERAEAGRSPPRFEPPVIEDIKEPPSSAFSQVTLEPDEDYDEQDEEEDDEVRDDPINIESGPHLVRPQHGARSEYYPMGPAQVPRLDHYSGPQPEGFEPAQFHPGQFQHHDPYQQAYQGPHYLRAPANNFHVAGFAQRGDHVHSAPYTPQVQTTALPEVYSWPPTPSDPVPPSATTSGFTPSPMSSRWTRPLPPGSPSSSYPATNYPRGALFRDDGRYVGGAMESFNAYQGAPIQAPPAHRRPVPSPPIFGYDMILSYFQTWRAKNKPQTYLEYQYEQPRADGSWALVGNWWERDDLSVADRDRFLNLFMPYRKQAGFEVWMPDFLASLHNPPARRPHPGFMWAIYSCAAFFSGDPELLALLPAFMERARRNLEESFARSDRLFDYIRGQTLYASIMYMSGKTNEGAMAATAACHAAIVCGLHKIFSPTVVPQAQHQERSGYRIRQIDFHLEPATSPREHGERITAFWQLLLVDLSAAATTGVPPMFRDDGDERSRIETVFPRPLEEYMNGQAERVPYATLGDIFTSNAIPNPPDIVLTIQIKATALLERAVRLATKWPRGSHISTTDPVKYQDEYNTVVSAIQHFRTYIPSLRPQEGDFAESQLNLTVSGLIFEWIFPHFMLLNAQIRLYNMLEEEAARNLCLDSAYGISHLTSQLTDEEIPQLGVLLGHCFDAAEVVFEGALDSCQDHVRGEYQGHLDALKHAREPVDPPGLMSEFANFQ